MIDVKVIANTAQKLRSRQFSGICPDRGPAGAFKIDMCVGPLARSSSYGRAYAGAAAGAGAAYPDAVIAGILNKQGRRTAYGTASARHAEARRRTPRRLATDVTVSPERKLSSMICSSCSVRASYPPVRFMTKWCADRHGGLDHLVARGDPPQTRGSGSV